MILLTGCAGFIGMNFLQILLERQMSQQLVLVDKFTYAANDAVFLELVEQHNMIFYQGDIADARLIKRIFDQHAISAVVNFAAESHVDNSIRDLGPFIHSNILGTVNLLQQSAEHGVDQFLQISTDEVFGDIAAPGVSDESSQIMPRNPYSASKASAEHFAWAFHNTFGVPVMLVNCSNNYGPYQHAEKFIPRAITCLITGQSVPVYGDGQQIRDWIFVRDCAQAILLVLEKGQPGCRYCIGTGRETTNADLVRMLQDSLGLREDMIGSVKDRPGHDRRYAMDPTRITRDLGWRPKVSLEQGLQDTVAWYSQQHKAGLV